MDKMGWKSKAFYVSVIIIATLALFKYVQYPEPYTFSTECNDYRIKVNGNQIAQPIVLNDKSVWEGDACVGIYLSPKARPTSGSIEFSLTQGGKVLSSAKIGPSDIIEGFYEVKGLDYSQLDARGGNSACIEIAGENLDQDVYLRTTDDIYNLPKCRVNGNESNYVLAQKYHFHFENGEHAIRVALYVIFIVTNIIAAFLLFRLAETAALCRVMQLCVAISYIAATVIYDCKVLFFPIYNDVPMNYVHDAINYGIIENILANDGGYYPLLQRLIAVFIFKVLHVQAYYAVYAMQIAGYLLAGYFFSFFLKTYFKDAMPLAWRYLLCLLCSLFFSGFQQAVYICSYLGIVVILSMFLTDMGKWSRRQFVALSLFSLVICLSKGGYVSLIPFMAVYIVLFHERMGRREKAYILACSTGCIAQLLYYFLYGVNTSYGVATHWTSRAIVWENMNGRAVLKTFAKLFYSVFVDVPSRLLAFFGDAVGKLNGVSFLLVIAFWGFFACLFYKKILLCWIHRREVDDDYARLFLLLSYIAIHDFFLRITVHGVSDIRNDTLFTFNYRGVSDKYAIFIMIAVIGFYFVAARILSRRYGTAIKQASLPVFVFLLMFSNAHLQLYGIGNEQFCAGRIYADTNVGEPVLLKGIEEAECRTYPIMGEPFLYSRNAKTYCFGENVFNWKIEHGNLNLGDIEIINDGSDFSTGAFQASSFPNINGDCEIWQVYVSRTSLLNNKKYKIVARDERGEKLLELEQDNATNQLVTSFTFTEPLDHIGSFEIRDIDGNRVKIKNGIYLVVEQNDNLFLQDN